MGRKLSLISGASINGEDQADGGEGSGVGVSEAYAKVLIKRGPLPDHNIETALICRTKIV